MTKQLPTLKQFWDPGRVKVLNHKCTLVDTHYILAQQAPHFQRMAMLDANAQTRKTRILILPVPYIYYWIRIKIRPSGYISTKVVQVGCSVEEVDMHTKHICTLPLPNTGINFYTCSPSSPLCNGNKGGKELWRGLNSEDIKAKTLVVDELAKATIVRFWGGRFVYHENWGEPHAALYNWGGDQLRKNYISLKVYEKWAKLRLKDLPHQPWLRHPGPLRYSQKWIDA